MEPVTQPAAAPVAAPAAAPAPVVAPAAAAPAVDITADLRARFDAFTQSLFSGAKPAAPAAPVAPAPASAPADTEAKTLRDRVAFLEADNAQKAADATSAARTAAIDKAFAANKVSPADQALLRPYLESNFGAGIKVESGKVVFNSAQTGEQPLDVVVANILASDVGKRLMPAPSLPTGDGLKPGASTPAGAASGHPWLGKTPNEIKDLALKNQTEFAKFQKAHPAEAMRAVALLI